MMAPTPVEPESICNDRDLALALRSLPKVPELRVERAPECRPCCASLDISCEAPVAGYDVGVAQDAQHGRHHEIARGKAVAVEIGLVAQRLGQGCQAVTYERLGTGAAKFCPLLIGVEQINQGDVHHEGLNGIERRDQPLRGAGSRLGILRQKRFAALADVQHDGARFEQHKVVLHEDRDLAERLQRTILRLVPVALLEEARLVGETGLLEGPAHAQITYLTLCEWRYRMKGRDRDHAACSFAIFSTKAFCLSKVPLQPPIWASRRSTLRKGAWWNVWIVWPSRSSKVIVTTVSIPADGPSSQVKVKTRRSSGTISR